VELIQSSWRFGLQRLQTGLAIFVLGCVLAALCGGSAIAQDEANAEPETAAAATETAATETTPAKTIDEREITGWFTEDFTWEELQQLRCTERIPKLRAANTEFNGAERILSLPEVLGIAQRGGIGVVVEVKHAPYFERIGLDLAPLVARDLRAAGWQDPGRGRLVIESFEESALHEVRDAGIEAEYVYLLEDEGAAHDLRLALGSAAPSYRKQLADLASLAERVDGISVAKSLLLDPDAPAFAAEARERGLELFTWTARPENAFLDKRFRGSGARAEYGEWRAEWRAIREAGVTGVFADHPDLAREVFSV